MIKLLDVRVGPGAAVLPPNIIKIQLDFAKKMNDGHMGPRKFWHVHMPRLKFHNPSVPMSVNRTMNPDSQATLAIFFSQNHVEDPGLATDNFRRDSGAREHIESINMKNKQASEIFTEFLEVTKAVEVGATDAELHQLKEIEEHQAKSDRDRTRSNALMEARRREQQLLAQAQQAIA